MHICSTKINVVFMILVVFMVCLLLSCGDGGGSDGERTITFSALLPISGATGAFTTSGESSSTAIELAVSDVNDYLTENGAGFKITVMEKDTQADPSIAFEKAEESAAEGVKVIIGPLTSAEAEELLPWANENQVLMISPSSTAPSLAIEDDNLFRLCTDDVNQAAATVQKFVIDGIKTVVPVWRNDIYGSELIEQVRSAFHEEEEGEPTRTVTTGVSYAPDTTDFTSVAAALNSALSDALTENEAHETAVYLISFDEAGDIIKKVKDDPVLSSVNWYASDSTALNHEFTTDDDVADFALATHLTAPLYHVDSDESAVVSSAIEEVIGREPDSFTLIAYDAVWVAAMAYLSAGTYADTETLKAQILVTAEEHQGITGWTILNNAGDREYGSYSFWQIQESEGQIQWVKVYWYHG